MPWTEQQHAAAVSEIRGELEARPDADLDPRVLESIALENAGNALHPRTRRTLEGRRLDRALTSGRYDRWATIVWRCRLAETAARSIVRREAFSSGEIEEAIETAVRLREARR